MTDITWHDAEKEKPNDIPSYMDIWQAGCLNNGLSLIEKAFEQYLGKPLELSEAENCRINNYNDSQYLYYKDVHIGTITGAWDISVHSYRYVWTYTPTLPK